MTGAKGAKGAKGASIIEIAPVLFVLLLMLTFPLINLATSSLRYTFLVTASRDAADAASKSKTFQDDSSSTSLSAVHTADIMARRIAAGFKGITLDNISTNLVITDIASQTVARQSSKLSQAADTSTYLYNIEVILTGKVSPLINYGGGILPQVPGLSAPMSVSVQSLRYCEYPDGLNR